SNPVGDPFDIDYVAHEMGHQYRGNHTFNGTTSNCSGGNRNGSTAWEPGSGSTIMAYAGICGSEDLQPHSDPYFHVGSFDEISAFTQVGGGNACAAITNTGNNFPTVDAGPAYTIPNQTPFKLTGSATDPDGDALTYNWEQFDIGTQSPPNTDNGNRPIFRSFEPVPVPYRYLPRLSDILGNTLTFGEAYPTTNRNLTFRLTARDNRAGAGGVNYDEVDLTVTTTSGPFDVTSPNTAVTWPGGSNQTVTWDVANTTAAPVSCANVDLTLSTDGGAIFPNTLAAGTPNDGTEQIVVPNVNTTTARVMAQCSDNIFLDISDTNFTITLGPTATPTVCPLLFTDVPEGSTFYENIRCLACRGIIDGYTKGCETGNPCFKPSDYVTRGQLAKIVSNSAGFSDPAGPQQFEDVPLGSTFFDFIWRLAFRGIISGYPCDDHPDEPCIPPYNRPYFRPNADITRGQISKIVSEAAGYTDIPGAQQFEDVPLYSTYYDYIWRLADRGIMSGYPCGGEGEPCNPPYNRPYFRPGKNATRGQASRIVANTFFPECVTPRR
ncbi:MAG: S-layer homology domain-containing protein, partial [Chloroflexia bacterium]